MVKDIPLTLYAHHAPVAVAHGVSGVHQLPAIQADITGRMDRTFVTESLVRKKAHGIVQTGYVSSWVDEVIPLSDMADGRSFPIVRPLRIEVSRQNNSRPPNDRQHIGA